MSRILFALTLTLLASCTPRYELVRPMLLSIERFPRDEPFAASTVGLLSGPPGPFLAASAAVARSAGGDCWQEPLVWLRVDDWD
jgi:hypothetical protein